MRIGFGSFHRIADGHRLVLVPMDDQHRPMILPDRFLHMDRLGHPRIVSAEDHTVHAGHDIRDMLRIEAQAQQLSLPSPFRDHAGR